MRKTMLTLIGLALFSASGCVGVSASHTTSKSASGDKEVAVVGDRVFVVCKKTGKAKTVDLSAATPFDKDEGEE